MPTGWNIRWNYFASRSWCVCCDFHSCMTVITSIDGLISCVHVDISRRNAAYSRDYIPCYVNNSIRATIYRPYKAKNSEDNTKTAMTSPKQARLSKRGLPAHGANPIPVRYQFPPQTNEDRDRVPPIKRSVITNIIVCALLVAVEAIRVLATLVDRLCKLVRPAKAPQPANLKKTFRRISRRLTANFTQLSHILRTLEEVGEEDKEEAYSHSE